jgi:4-hydroxy-4-methyl-2-oxoglutarate aldolase
MLLEPGGAPARSDSRGLEIRDFVRPDPDLVFAFAEVAASEAANLLGSPGGLSHRIGRICGSDRFAGPALTVQVPPGDNLAVLAGLGLARPGDVMVVATEECDGVAMIGDRIAGMAANCGMAGIVTDGLVRDRAGMARIGLPVHARGLSPNSPRREGPGVVGGNIRLGEIQVAAGDLIVGDEDGVAVLPRDRLAEALERLRRLRREEEAAAGAIAAGLRCPAWVAELLSGSGRTA